MESISVGSEELKACLASLGQVLQKQGLICATAESCTGGLLGAAITGMPGASAWYAGGIVAYANHVKSGVLGVSDDILLAHGAVSEECVCAMAEGACRVLKAHVAVSVSGVAGPGGGTEQKPVGTVWLGFCVKKNKEHAGNLSALKLQLSGDREHIRAQATLRAMQELYAQVSAQAIIQAQNQGSQK